MLQGVSCMIVILFHCPLEGMIGEVIIYACRFPIPIFFMSAGYFLYGKNNYPEKVRTFVKYIFFAETAAFVSLAIRSLITSSITPITDALQANLSWKTIFFVSLFNVTLWYLYAMVWTYVILYALSKWKYGFKLGYASIILLLVLHIAGRVYVTVHYDIDEWVFLFRSAILFAVPFVLIGRYIAEKKDVLRKYLNYCNIGAIFGFGMLLMVIEFVVWHRFMDLQVSTIFLSVALFLFALYRPNVQLLGIFRYIGKNMLLYVYVFHMPVIIIVRAIFRRIGYENQNVTVLIVIASTLALSYIGAEVKNGQSNQILQRNI